ncbi:hypothetical protein J6590_042661, partial [Homalodisca vitripennis]
IIKYGEKILTVKPISRKAPLPCGLDFMTVYGIALSSKSTLNSMLHAWLDRPAQHWACDKYHSPKYNLVIRRKPQNIPDIEFKERNRDDKL